MKNDNSHPKSCWIFHQVLTMKKSSNLKHKCLNWLELYLPVYCGVVLIYVYDIIWNIITTMDIFFMVRLKPIFKVLIYIISTQIYISYICYDLWDDEIKLSKGKCHWKPWNNCSTVVFWLIFIWWIQIRQQLIIIKW